MENQTKAGLLFTCLGFLFLGFGAYLLIGTSFFFLGNGVIASGLGMLIGLDKIKKARWIIGFLRKIPVIRQVLSLPIIWHICNYICPEEPEDTKKARWIIGFLRKIPVIRQVL